jgi:5-dehydro-4-deoxyglucarate dehydratase
LDGVLVLVPTPFTYDDRVDHEGLARHINHLCTIGVHGIVACGEIGEFFSLDLDEYRTVVRTVVEAARRRVPVLAGIGHSTRVACQLAHHAEMVGADGLMINPFYCVDPAEDGVVRHCEMLARATGLGMMVFSSKGAVCTPAMAERLARIDSVVAFKDENGDLRMFIETVERLGNRLVWVNGTAETLAAPYFAAGARVFTSAIANFAPHLSMAVWEAGTNGSWDDLNAIVAYKVRPVAALRERRKGYGVAVVKEAMNMLGMPGGIVRSPLVPLTLDDREDLRKILEELELLPL